MILKSRVGIMSVEEFGASAQHELFTRAQERKTHKRLPCKPYNLLCYNLYKHSLLFYVNCVGRLLLDDDKQTNNKIIIKTLLYIFSKIEEEIACAGTKS